jgi:hypothetical protein
MKALISAFALLSFVAASTIPYVAQAQAQTEMQKPMPKKAKKSHKTAKRTMHHKKVAKHKSKRPVRHAQG